ncbi:MULTISPECIES: class I SAM-dependent methyltransferase [unclassified Streptomyces]|uniref:class I SAM-dependent methyltransferase n=1 Tax=unclassified Streptomyces TaxID=2593676 RepID=UPI001161EA8D|nr:MULTISPECIES: class I SAM-dependent methyltransferase [unclassified Streptomyces]NMI62889.1 class I SAM-dependent methyltransferase [Streptomyces sp. RLA2-12]QDN61853.1 class I SAM-dependent methyltransferase [Streptomyces sp. S1D4-20]QDN71906.1 class I SAM-dependent methyltransferase [Streptomyces sp. S1D4-14]QDO54363.1 class I SAM-dependent methyltransferase [Streptomyces sp. RLB3-5]QDO64608.1 class I SAM-dependent methyltransferase [Streptomyces sp. RLB1-8]
MSDIERTASRTAVLVCQGRAAADGRLAAGRFADAVAVRLLRPPERAPVDEVREGTPSTGWKARATYEGVRACAEVVVPRTVAIDDALRSHGTPQLVVLGAGLDSRAWRLPELADTDVWEVDHPASQQDKQERLAEAGTPPVAAGSVRFAPVDFATDDLCSALEATGHDASVPTTWLWEGVVPYLTHDEVRATVRAVADRSAPGSALVLNYQGPSVKASAGRLIARVLNSSVTASEPWRSLWKPQKMAALLAEYGLRVVSDEDLLAIANRLESSMRGRTSLRSGRVAVARRA